MKDANYIISWVFNFIIATCTIWASIKYIEPIKYIKFSSPNRFISNYISLGNFIKIYDENNKFSGNYSPYFETLKNGLWNDVYKIKHFNIKTGENKIISYISKIENSSLYIFYNNEEIQIFRLNTILK